MVAMGPSYIQSSFSSAFLSTSPASTCSCFSSCTCNPPAAHTAATEHQQGLLFLQTIHSATSAVITTTHAISLSLDSIPTAADLHLPLLSDLLAKLGHLLLLRIRTLLRQPHLQRGHDRNHHTEDSVLFNGTRDR